MAAALLHRGAPPTVYKAGVERGRRDGRGGSRQTARRKAKRVPGSPRGGACQPVGTTGFWLGQQGYAIILVESCTGTGGAAGCDCGCSPRSCGPATGSTIFSSPAPSGFAVVRRRPMSIGPTAYGARPGDGAAERPPSHAGNVVGHPLGGPRFRAPRSKLPLFVGRDLIRVSSGSRQDRDDRSHCALLVGRPLDDRHAAGAQMIGHRLGRARSGSRGHRCRPLGSAVNHSALLADNGRRLISAAELTDVRGPSAGSSPRASCRARAGTRRRRPDVAYVDDEVVEASTMRT